MPDLLGESKNTSTIFGVTWKNKGRRCCYCGLPRIRENDGGSKFKGWSAGRVFRDENEKLSATLKAARHGTSLAFLLRIFAISHAGRVNGEIKKNICTLW